MKARGPTGFLFLLWGGMLYAQTVDNQKAVPSHRGTDPDRKVSGANMLKPLRIGGTLSDTARLEWVRHFSLNRATSRDIASDVTIDAGGCVYVTGKSESGDSGYDYLTIKYDVYGQEVWRAQYDGPAHADDDPLALVIDAAGNVYVTGMSRGIDEGSSTSYDYATIKYNSAGRQLWVSRYGRVPGGRDAASSIAVDVAGNVYVTGVSADSVTHRMFLSDLATVKYDPNGAEQWVRRHTEGTFSGIENAALALDDSGNIVVVGSSSWWDSTSRSQVVTLKYKTDGVLEWADRMTDSTFVAAVDIGIGHSSSIYIAGYSGDPYSWRHCSSLLIVKYGPDGQRQWLRAFSDSLGARAGALSVDRAGNVVVAGTKGGYYWEPGNSALIVKYSQAGDLLWANTYTEPDHSYLAVDGLGVDDKCNVTMAASSFDWNSKVPELMSKSLVTLKYDATGVMRWVQRLDGGIDRGVGASAIAVHGSGSLVVAGGAGPTKAVDFITLKYQPSGNLEWDARATGGGTSFESLNDMTVDAAGNLYITGSSLGARTSSDYFTAEFDRNGTMLWSALYNSPDSGYDYPSKIAVDRLGNVYVTGSTTGHGRNGTHATVKYAPDGSQLWVATQPVTTWYANSPFYLGVDSWGNSYVGGSDCRLKYNSEGHKIWEGHDCVRAMTLDRHNSLYFSTDSTIVRIDSMGEQQILIHAPASSLAVDDSGYIFVTRHEAVSETRKYSPSGDLVWLQGHGGDEIQLDQTGSVFVKLCQDWNDTVLSKINANGTFAWSKITSWPFERVANFAVDNEGCSYLSMMRVPGGFGGPDFQTVKYNPAGIQLWSARYDGPGGPAETPYAIAVDGPRGFYLGGITEREGHSTDITLLRYSELEVSVKDEPPELPLDYSLAQNYPNPFNPSTTIRFAIPTGKYTHTSLRVYDILGREVATLVNDDKKPGNYRVSFDGSNLASGMYFYRLESGGFVDTKKLMLIK